MSGQHTLIKSATVYDPSSGKNGETFDILITEGHIKDIKKSIPVKTDYSVIDAKGMVIIPGMFDMRVRAADPGYEHKEDLLSLTDAAMAGGVTGIAAIPDTDPVVQSKSIVEYIQTRTSRTLTDVHVLGAATFDLKGEELTELYDLKLAGVVGYSNGDNAYKNPGVLKRVLMYTKDFGLPVFSHAEETSLVQNGSVNESEVTLHTGLKVRPAIAEYTEIRRQIDVLRYSGGHLHFSHISSAESVNIIKQAKKEGLNISCDVSIYHLAFTDKETLDFDSNFKVMPPLRSEKDRKALVKGLKDRTIDAIVSDHCPQNIEEKKKEFDFAGFGAIGVQTLLQVYETYLKEEITWNEWLTATVINPRKLLGLTPPSIQKGNKANLALFSEKEEWVLNKETNRSRAVNHPLWGKSLKGAVKFVCNGVQNIHV